MPSRMNSGRNDEFEEGTLMYYDEHHTNSRTESRKQQFWPDMGTIHDTCLDYFEAIVKPCIAEFIGSCIFVFMGCMSVQNALTVQPLTAEFVPSTAAVAIAHGLTITVLVMAFGPVSGGHFNPAVTLGVSLAGAMSPVLAVWYVLSQFIGGIIGAALVKASLTARIYEQISGGAHIISEVGPGQAILCEAVITTTLVLTVTLVALDGPSKTKFAPLAIGFAVSIGIFAAMNVTGGSMNPIRSFGPALLMRAFTQVTVFEYHYVYWVGPALGGIIAAFIYRLFFALPEKRLIFHSGSL